MSLANATSAVNPSLLATGAYSVRNLVLKGTSKNSYFVAPAKAGVQSNQQAGFPPSRE